MPFTGEREGVLGTLNFFGTRCQCRQIHLISLSISISIEFICSNVSFDLLRFVSFVVSVK